MTNSEKKIKIIRNLKKAVLSGKKLVFFDNQKKNLRTFNTKREEQAFINSHINHYLTKQNNIECNQERYILIYFDELAKEKLEDKELIEKILVNEFTNIHSYRSRFIEIFKRYHPLDDKDKIIQELSIELTKHRVAKVIYNNFLAKFKGNRSTKEVSINSVAEHLVSVVRQYFDIDCKSLIKDISLMSDSEWFKNFCKTNQAMWFRKNFDRTYKSNESRTYKMTDFKIYDKHIPKTINEYKLSKSIEEFINPETIEPKYVSEAKRYYSNIIYKVQFCCISELNNRVLIKKKKKINIIENISLEQVKDNKIKKILIPIEAEVYIPNIF